MWEIVWIVVAILVVFAGAGLMFRFAPGLFGLSRTAQNARSVFRDDDYATSYALWRDGFDMTKPQRLGFKYKFTSQGQAEAFGNSLAHQSDLTLSIQPDEKHYRVVITILMLIERQALRYARMRWHHEVQMNKGVYEGWGIND